jgi:hypothetical protein
LALFPGIGIMDRRATEFPEALGCISATGARFPLLLVDEEKPGKEVRFVLFCASATP